MSDFWSRRKAEVEAEAQVAAQADTQADVAAADTVPEDLSDLPEAELLEKLGLPDPDTIRSGDDLSAFMTGAVPRAIRNRALRSLWRSNPVLANLDGLNDYDGDFTGNGLNGGVLKTSYEVGKGLAAHVRRLADAESDKNDQEKTSQPIEEKTLAEGGGAVEPYVPRVCPEEEEEAPVMPSRGMRFTFEEDDGI